MGAVVLWTVSSADILEEKLAFTTSAHARTNNLFAFSLTLFHENTFRLHKLLIHFWFYKRRIYDL